MYAIIDIETTGGKFNKEGMTEIAIHKFDGQKTVDQFITLVNPEMPIQPFVIQLTGITDKMVKTAPKFHEIAKRIIEITEGCTVVAHNSSFDYRILQNEFNRLGYKFVRDTICTVELSRKLIPDQPSYSLGKLCRNLGIPTSNRHRANGDAIVTVKLFKLLLQKDIEKQIISKNKKAQGKSKSSLSLHFQKLLDKASRKTGVYYIHDTEGKILYIGKNKNIRTGINQLLLRSSSRAIKLHKRINDISFDETGNLLLANLKYKQEIEKKHPKFNAFRTKHIPTTVFNIENAIFIDKGRIPSEKCVYLLENGIVKGYGFIELAHQISDIAIVKNIITPLEDNLFNREQIKKHINENKFKEIIRFDS
ncbi:exonuclease domain-containing protein [Flavobacteriaceae bacterium]|nr:exonuclease domain-containing protein [Flavobacteriaceae bacterium]